MKKTLFALLLLCSTAAIAAPRIGHHGDWVVKCHPPMFFGEKPAKDSQVSVVQNFEFSASENTDTKTLKVWVNNQLHNVSIEKQRSGHYRIAGKLSEPLRQGKAWIKVTSESDDGCNKLQAWNVYIE
jgi:hypothetical protein